MRHLLSALLLILFTATPTQADSLGRLFFTPQQRAQLEQECNATTESEPPTSTLTVNGIVQKKGGARTAWINGVAQNAGNCDEHNAEMLPVSVPGKSQPLKVKVGQKIILERPARMQAAEPQQHAPKDSNHATLLPGR